MEFIHKIFYFFELLLLFSKLCKLCKFGEFGIFIFIYITRVGLLQV